MFKMDLRSLNARLALLFVLLFALVVATTVVTLWSLEDQRQDAVIINLAGRQRLLLQRMLHEASEFRLQRTDLGVTALEDAIQIFAQTLSAFEQGGEVSLGQDGTTLIMPGVDLQMQSNLEIMRQNWGIYQDALELMLAEPVDSDPFSAALKSVEAMTPEMVEQADRIVNLFESSSQAKILGLRWIQGIFLVIGSILLAVSAWVYRKSAAQPLQSLSASAYRIGSGDLETPVEMNGPLEIRQLAQSLEDMRGCLKSSHEELLLWNTSLEQRVSQRTKEIEALYAVSREISSHLDINQVLESVTQKTRHLLDVDVVFLCLYDSQHTNMNLRASSGDKTAIAATSSPLKNPTVSAILSQDGAMRCDDRTCHGFCNILAESYRETHLASPLRVGREIIGALCVGSARSGKLDAEDAATLSKLANVTAVALQNAQLYEQAERAATLEERARIAADMHDGLAQTLSFMRLTVDQAMLQLDGGQVEKASNTLERLHGGLAQSVEDVRMAIASLQGDGPLRESLLDRVTNLAAEFKEKGMAVDVVRPGDSLFMLPRHEIDCAYFVVREAMINALHHSRSDRIEVCMENQDDKFKVIIRDWGAGFLKTGQPQSVNCRHFGLDIMQARAARIGGDLEVVSSLGEGTQVILSWESDQRL